MQRAESVLTGSDTRGVMESYDGSDAIERAGRGRLEPEP
jgi:hypothetical protein